MGYIKRIFEWDDVNLSNQCIMNGIHDIQLEIDELSIKIKKSSGSEQVAQLEKFVLLGSKLNKIINIIKG